MLGKSLRKKGSANSAKGTTRKKLKGMSFKQSLVVLLDIT